MLAEFYFCSCVGQTTGKFQKENKLSMADTSAASATLTWPVNPAGMSVFA